MRHVKAFHGICRQLGHWWVSQAQRKLNVLNTKRTSSSASQRKVCLTWEDVCTINCDRGREQYVRVSARQLRRRRNWINDEATATQISSVNVHYQTASPHISTTTPPACIQPLKQECISGLSFSTYVSRGYGLSGRCRRSAAHIKHQLRAVQRLFKKSSADSTTEPIVFPLDRWSSVLHVGLECECVCVCAPVKALMHYKGLTQITVRHDNAWQVVLLKGGPVSRKPDWPFTASVSETLTDKGSVLSRCVVGFSLHFTACWFKPIKQNPTLHRITTSVC